MLVVMKAQATKEEIAAVCEHIEALGYRAHPMPGAQRTAIGITGNQGEVDRGNLEELPGVAEVIRVSKPYKLVSRDVKEEDTVIRFPGTDATIGGAKGYLAMRDAGEDFAELGVDAADVGGQRLYCGEEEHHEDGQGAHGRLALGRLPGLKGETGGTRFG